MVSYCNRSLRRPSVFHLLFTVKRLSSLPTIYHVNTTEVSLLTLLHSEWPKLCRVLAVLSAIGLKNERLILLWVIKSRSMARECIAISANLGEGNSNKTCFSWRFWLFFFFFFFQKI